MDFVNREFISAVRGTVLINFRTVVITPKDSILFPLLSQIARNFELYKFHKLEFYYKSQTSTASNQAIASQGSCIFNIIYDPTLPPFTSKNDILNYAGCQSCKPSESMKITMRPMYKFKDVFALQTTPNLPTSDVRNTSPGTFTFATQGQANANDVIGDLYCYYEITLAKPKLYNTLGGSNPGYYAMVPGSTNTWAGTTLTVPNSASIRENTIQCTWLDDQTFRIPIIDGWIILVRMSVLNPLTTLGAVGDDFFLTGQQHIFIPFEPEQEVTTAASTPRTCVYGISVNNTTVARMRYPSVTITTKRPAMRFVMEMMIKCRGQLPVTLTCPPQTRGNPVYVSHEVRVMNRPEAYDQSNPLSKLINPSWFTT